MTSQIQPAVVVGVDGSQHSLAALDLAADEATRRREPLRIIAAFLWPMFSLAAQVPSGAIIDEALDAASRMLTDAADKIQRAYPGLTITTEVVIGSPTGVLVGESERASVVVVGNRGHGGFTSLLAGSVATQLATHARCPVIVVRPGSTPSATTRPVLVGVDGRERTEPAIEFAFEEAASRGAALTAVHIWSEPPRPGSEPFKPVVYEYGEAEREAERLLAETLAGFQEKYPDVPVAHELVYGVDPAYHLRRASAEASLVVVGSQGRGELSGLLLGSVGQSLVHHAQCPVAIVRPGAAETR